MSAHSIPVLWRLGAPPLRDPRWSVAAIQLLFILLGLTALSFPVSGAQVLVVVAVAVAAEMVLGKLVVGQITFPLSALITGFGLSLLLRGDGLFIFALAALAAVGSKYLFRVSDGHIFNPSNFGLMLALALPLGAATITPGQWGAFPLLVLVVLGLGYIVGRQASRLWLVGGFAAGILVAVDVWGVASGDFFSLLGGHFNAAVMLFAFFMITDPRTSPSSQSGQLVFGLAVGAGGAALGLAGIAAGIFWALLIGCAVYGLLRARGLAPSATRWASFATGSGGGNVRLAAPHGLTPSSSGGGITRGAFMKRALLGGAGVGVLAAVGACSSDQQGSSSENEAQQKLEFLRNSFIASGGGINLKQFPDGNGGQTEMRELFSFDRNYAFCTVENVQEAFIMPTHEMGEVKVEPNSFYMEMITTKVTNVRVEEDSETGKLMAKIDGNLECATQAGTSSVTLGSRKRSEAENATFTITARDTTGESLPIKEPRAFRFTTFFDEEEAPVNHSIFGPEFTFTGDMISGRITVQPVTDLFPEGGVTSEA